jgi:hypothetical protein
MEKVRCAVHVRLVKILLQTNVSRARRGVIEIKTEAMPSR